MIKKIIIQPNRKKDHQLVCLSQPRSSLIHGNVVWFVVDCHTRTLASNLVINVE